jgi:hypothetical protein
MTNSISPDPTLLVSIHDGIFGLFAIVDKVAVKTLSVTKTLQMSEEGGAAPRNDNMSA